MRLATSMVPAFAATAALLAQPADAQKAAHPGFDSIGRGAPLAVALPSLTEHMERVVLPLLQRDPEEFARQSPQLVPREIQAFLRGYPAVGPMRFTPMGSPVELAIGSAWNGATPAGIDPLPVDVFTSRDFYRDRALWSDQRYWRCNSPMGVEIQHGNYNNNGEIPPLVEDSSRTAA